MRLVDGILKEGEVVFSSGENSDGTRWASIVPADMVAWNGMPDGVFGIRTIKYTDADIAPDPKMAVFAEALRWRTPKEEETLTQFWQAWSKEVQHRWAKLREKYGPNATRHDPEQEEYYQSLTEQK